MAGVHPARRCTPFQGALLVGLEAGVGDCRGVTVALNAAPFFPSFFGGANHVLFSRIWGNVGCILLDILVATPG